MHGPSGDPFRDRRERMQIACIIPAFNEETTIGRIVGEALKYCSTVLVVDDNSQDHTAHASENAGAVVVKHMLRLGTGGALSTGFKAALRTDCKVFLTIDGDGQHNPDEIPILIDPILKGEADLVIGSRFIEGHQSMPLHKKLGNKVLSTATSFASGRRITDSQSGFRAHRREVLEFAIHSGRDYRWASETLILAARGNFKIKEVPITTTYLEKRKRGAGMRDGLKILYSTAKRVRRPVWILYV